MYKKLFAVVTVATIAIGSSYTKPNASTEIDAPEKTEAWYQGLLTDMRGMSPEGENGQWATGQIVWLREACAEVASRPVDGNSGDEDITEICASVPQ